MEAKELKKAYLDFFASKKHAIVDSAPMIPEHDPTVLFTTAGMHPLVPFILGQKHPLGKKLSNVQKCLRTGDIDEVGDYCHHTFFEMLGNWSLGDYFKKEAIEMTFEFLIEVLKLPLDKLAFSCFKGDQDAPKDEESYGVWLSLGVPKERIAYLGKEDNWWGPAGETGPCGPDTEMFYWTDKEEPAPKKFNADDKRWVEIGNNVFMQYDKQKDGTLKPLKQKSVDFGGGVDRLTAVMQGLDDNYTTEQFLPIIEEIEKITGKKYVDETRLMRIIADHMRAAVFVLGDEREVIPSNVDQGYVLRRLIRRSVKYLDALGVDLKTEVTTKVAEKVIELYKEDYPLLESKMDFILDELRKEEQRFELTLKKGLKIFEKLAATRKKIEGKDAFLLFQSYGFPIEMTQELASEKKIKVDINGFDEEYKKHQDLSRIGAEKKFKGGLSDASEETVKLHTATHLLNEALRKIVSPDIKQKGSNITAERLRFDFNFDRKLTAEEKQAVEDEVNRVIDLGMKITREEIPLKAALKSGAVSEFGTKYPEKVSVYSVEEYSKEICMGPHVKNTKELGRFKIKKEESSSAGVRRIKAVLVKG
ncbi:MAG: alanine--tRNA ligase [archaeon]|nr:alanine--tRNA ligase [Nanoarchaeota archaeon]